uniref:Uncharacterized protein n=1 Tax=Musca domestica TaxID=7370 RepID=A0A1I8NJ41_MUSDO
MSDSSKPQQQRSGATPIKNPLLSASVTGLTFDDFPNKPQLLPAAPPIVHAPVPPPSVTPSALLGREPKSLVTVGSSSLDTENLDEINLNASATEETTTNSSDANANLLWEQQQSSTSDSILSQAASSFSALPSVASNVFSSFSKRITGISSRETTPGYDTTNSADSNGNNSNVPQLDIQPNYTQHQQQQQHQQQFPQQQQQYQYPTPGQPLAPPPGQSSVPPAGQPFYAPPLPPSSGGYFESNLLPNTNLEASNIPPAEPL